MRYKFRLASVLILLASCSNKNGNLCDAIQSSRAATNAPVTIGERLEVNVVGYDGAIFNWTGPNNFRSSTIRNTIDNADLKNEGMYYVGISHPGCNTKSDSVYVDIKLKQGNPSCTINNNTAVYNNLGTDVFTSVSKSIDANGFLNLYAFGSTGNLRIIFHQHWKTIEPEDGIYKTRDIPAFDLTDFNYNKIFIETIKNSISFRSQLEQNVYISHVNGKLQVRFCSITMSGSNNSQNFSTVCSANLIQP